jgi:hypothetical protein
MTPQIELIIDLLDALKDTVKIARKAIIIGGTDAEHADGRLEAATKIIARAEEFESNINMGR